MAGDGFAGAFGEDREDFLLAVGELEGFAAALQFPAGDLERVGAEHYLLDLRHRVRAAAAQDIVDAQDQLARIERLRQIVVGARLEPGNAALRLRKRRQHEDGQTSLGAQRSRQVDAVLTRHHDVEHDEVELQAGEPAPRFGRGAGDGDAKAVLGKILLQQIADAGVVVDHQEVRGVVVGRRGSIRHRVSFHGPLLWNYPIPRAVCRSGHAVLDRPSP